jgi:hypothetical protein
VGGRRGFRLLRPRAIRCGPTLVPLVLALLVAAPRSEAGAQSGAGRLDGTIGGGAARRSVAGATVEATRVQPEPVASFVARGDDRGRYRFDSLPPGEYAVRLSTAWLDSLGLTLPERPVTVAAGQRARLDFTLPAGAALRDAVCPGLELGPGRGAVAGHATDPDTEQPLVGATVVVSWKELAVDRATLKTQSEERVATMPSGERGEYRLCGVPTATALSLQLQQADRASAEVKVTVTDEEGAVARDLSLQGSRATATLVGTVRGAAGQPLAETELRVEGAPAVAVSDARGRYSLTGLAAGTQVLSARRIGYEAVQLPVELRAGKTVERDVELSRVVSLDSIRVVAMRSQYPEFEYNRRSNPFGVFLGPEDIERRRAKQTSDLFVGIAGLTGSGHGSDAVVTSVHGRAGAGKCAGMALFINGHPDVRGMNNLAVRSVRAIEVYPQGAFAPSQYSIRGSCGVIVIWTEEARKTIRPPDGVKSAGATRPGSS